MKQVVADYFLELTQTVGQSWNRFWYSTADALPLAVLRIFIGIACVLYLMSHGPDLVRWFGADGLLPVQTVRAVEQAGDQNNVPMMRWSHLNALSSPAALWSAHGLALVAAIAFSLGFYTRISSIATFVMILGYVHRGPFITAQVEPVLTMMLFYLCLGPAGCCLSLDRVLQSRRQAATTGYVDQTSTNSIAANVVIRLIQVHAALFYLIMGLSKLAGAPWWDGLGVWWLIAHTESRLVDLTFLHSIPYVVNLWTHMIVLFELSFAVFIWNRLARPILLAVAVPMWITLALVSGLVSFCALMLVVNLAYLPPVIFQGVIRRWLGNDDSRTDADSSHLSKHKVTA